MFGVVPWVSCSPDGAGICWHWNCTLGFKGSPTKGPSEVSGGEGGLSVTLAAKQGCLPDSQSWKSIPVRLTAFLKDCSQGHARLKKRK